MGSQVKVSEQERKRARSAYYQKHGSEPSTSQLDTFLLTYVATDGYGSGAITGSVDSGSYSSDCAPSSDSSYSSSDSGSSYSDSGSSGGDCGGGGGGGE